LAGQQIWYKNQLMDSFDWEALDRDMNNLKKRVLESQLENLKRGVSRPTWSPDLKKPDTIEEAKPPEEPPEPPDIFTESEDEKETTEKVPERTITETGETVKPKSTLLPLRSDASRSPLLTTPNKASNHRVTRLLCGNFIPYILRKRNQSVEA
jgi:hypothetical protein